MRTEYERWGRVVRSNKHGWGAIRRQRVRPRSRSHGNRLDWKRRNQPS